MQFQAFIVALLGSSVLASPGAPQDSTMSGKVQRITDLTRVASYITSNAVYVNNPVPMRRVTVRSLNAIGDQANADMAALAKRATLSNDEQSSLANEYATFLDVTNGLLAATVDKHLAVVAHSAAHSMGTAMNSTYGILSAWTDAMTAAAPTQKNVMTNQKALFSQAYAMAVGLYLNGPNGPYTA